jgi:hypothetical protein
MIVPPIIRVVNPHEVPHAYSCSPFWFKNFTS